MWTIHGRIRTAFQQLRGQMCSLRRSADGLSDTWRTKRRDSLVAAFLMTDGHRPKLWPFWCL
jgi:hypothetical protein